MISLIWAQDQNGVIGDSRTNQMPWPKISEDLHFLKEKTIGQIVVMGRKTFDSLNNVPLPGRKNIILTSSKYDHVKTINNLNYLKIIEKSEPNSNIYILGGRSVYLETLPFADYLYRTTIKAEFNGDIIMPNIEYKNYKKLSTKNVHTSIGLDLSFEKFKKITNSSKWT